MPSDLSGGNRTPGMNTEIMIDWAEIDQEARVVVIPRTMDIADAMNILGSDRENGNGIRTIRMMVTAVITAIDGHTKTDPAIIAIVRSPVPTAPQNQPQKSELASSQLCKKQHLNSIKTGRSA